LSKKKENIPLDTCKVRCRRPVNQVSVGPSTHKKGQRRRSFKKEKKEAVRSNWVDTKGSLNSQMTLEIVGAREDTREWGHKTDGPKEKGVQWHVAPPGQKRGKGQKKKRGQGTTQNSAKGT